MAFSKKTISILSSIALSVLLIVGAYGLSSLSSLVGIADAGSTDALLKAYAEKDTDSDGLFDWQESLYNTDPTNAHSVNKTVTDSEAVTQGLLKPKFESEQQTTVTVNTDIPGVDAKPGTLTDSFSRKFFEQYLTKRGAGAPNDAELKSFVESAAADLDRQTKISPAYTMRDVLNGNTGADGVAKYIQDMDRAVSANSPTAEKKDAFERFADYVNGADDSALTRVRTVGAAYSATGAAIMKVPAPLPIKEAHVRVANAYFVLGSVLADMGKMDSDPLRALVGASRYIDAWKEANEALANLASVVQAHVSGN